MPPMANHGLCRRESAAAARTRSRPGAGRPGLVGVGQHGPDAEVVDRLLDGGRGIWPAVVGGAADQRRSVADDVAGHRQRQIVLAQVQHVGAGGPGDVGAVVDGEQCAVPAAASASISSAASSCAGLQRAESLLAGRALVAELDDVHPAGQRGVGEFGEDRPARGARRCTGTAGAGSVRESVEMAPGTVGQVVALSGALIRCAGR